MATIYGYVGAAPEKGSAKFHVMIATPVGVNPSTDYARSLCATAEMLGRCNIQFTLHIIQGHCHVDDSRNMLLRDFLNSPCTDLFFIDADMGWKAQNLVRALHAPGDVVAGVYPHKSDAFTYPFHPPAGVPLMPNEHGLYEMPKVATGFMRIRRHVVEALYKREQEKGRCSRPGDELGDVLRSPIPVARIVERGFPGELGLEAESGNDLYNSGDYVLCLKIRQLGFKIFLDPNMEFGHTGEKVWVGHFGNLYRQRNGLFQQEFIDAVEELRKGSPTLDTFNRLCRHYGVPDKNYIPWPLAPEAMQAFYNATKAGSGDVLELGSGLSTLVGGLALAGTGRKIHALEHDAMFWRATAAMLQGFEVPNVALHLTPLLPEDNGTCSYALETAQDLPEKFGLVLIDGPPGRFGRVGVVHNLRHLIVGAELIIDDAGREEELLVMLRETSHDFQMQQGERWWATATPKKQVAEAAE
jgi:hypothetical protein